MEIRHGILRQQHHFYADRMLWNYLDPAPPSRMFEFAGYGDGMSMRLS
jgi:hypothetical protein